MNVGTISNPKIKLKPSKKLLAFIRDIKKLGMPDGLRNIKNLVKKSEQKEKPVEHRYFLDDDDRQFLKTIKSKDQNTSLAFLTTTTEIFKENQDFLINLEDLYWLYDYIQQQNSSKSEKIYLHELMEESRIVLPKNDAIPRNPELEKRCEKLRATQLNKEYNTMTKNVDNIRKRHPEDTISYQLQQMNRHLIAIFQFIMSVLAGFVFGFIGIELMIGSLDFGFRLLLGIIFALIIALAELYFLAKKLSEDLRFETESDLRNKNGKLD